MSENIWNCVSCRVFVIITGAIRHANLLFYCNISANKVHEQLEIVRVIILTQRTFPYSATSVIFLTIARLRPLLLTRDFLSNNLIFYSKLMFKLFPSIYKLGWTFAALQGTKDQISFEKFYTKRMIQRNLLNYSIRLEQQILTTRK